ncbi:DUF4160 domain-containing protein [Winogradskyella haliclonae]|uniref:DUF4160 domain-containing protein n=1 Tax=Winogradskyella haliclonae TaxID=2048558 RepID=A0ABQ2BYX1_9FLAO|nr:DUF4160 domain-containing protein [Winogradskyella haliclonae]GGI57007.1 hypothetical protein GCM10011444_13160 [Winogradskyella haliclonae]
MKEILKTLYEETKELKQSIESIELLNGNNNSEKGLLQEHLVKKFVNVKVKMYQENHNKPHIHIDIGKQNHVASIEIENQELLAGTIEKKYEKIVKKWIIKNKENLLIIWENMQKGQVFDLSVLS